MVNMITALCGYFSGTFVSDTGGTFKSDTPGTFVSDIGGTFEVILSIKRLRNNLADCPEITIENVRGYGYKLIIKA